MDEKYNNSPDRSINSGQDLRHIAETKLGERKMREAARPVTGPDLRHLDHELQVHQIELEMQNKELAQSQAETAELLRQYTGLYDFAPVGYMTLARDGTIEQLNLTGADLLGSERAALIKRRFGVFVSVDSRLAFSDFLDRVFATSGSKETCEVTLLKDGHELLRAYIEAVCIEDGQECRAVMSDITERKRTEADLRRTNAEIYDLYNNAPCGYHLLDKEGVFVRINKTELSWLGHSRDDVISKMKFTDMLSSQSVQVYRKHFQQLEEQCHVKDIELEMVRKDGTIMPVLLNATAIKDKNGKNLISRITVHDLTEYKNIEAQLHQAQKMDAVGRLAGGVAHDFNNILSAIVNYAYMIRSKAKEDEALINDINQITTLAMKAADITRGLLAFSRKHIIHPVPLKLNDSVKNMVKLLSKFIGEDIHINIKLTDIEPVVMADSAQLEQIIINLATNARDAMPDGGSLTIETDIAIIDNDFIKLHGFGWPGTYALLIITDTGTGMDEKTKQRIFEPFFTTKEIGKGSGLGLAIIYGIVKQHDGFINVYSEPGRGTTFKIYFQTVNAAVPEKEEVKPKDVAGNGETLLLAEDEEEVRNSVKFILEKSGYAVIEAADGYTAMEQFREHKDKIDLLLLDVIMPKKNGMEVYEEIKKITPGIKAIFISGYSAEVIDKKGVLRDDLNYITKPVPPEKLLSRIKEVLHNGQENPK